MKKLFNLAAAFIVLALVLLLVTGCGNNKDATNVSEENNEGENLVVDIIEIQTNFEMAISDLQTSFMMEISSNPDSYFCDYITFENLNEALKTYEYQICTADDIANVPEDMDAPVITAGNVYFTNGENIFSVTVEESEDKDQFSVETGNVELVK